MQYYKKDPFIKSKILCTLGPSSNSIGVIETLLDKGMDLARINFSHGNAEGKRELFAKIRMANPTLAILCDIQGPKIRIGVMEKEGYTLREGDDFCLTDLDVKGTYEEVSISHKELVKEVKPGEKIFINDGIICLEVLGTEEHRIRCKVLAGGELYSRKGLNLPTSEISLRVPTPKDVEDLKLIAELNPAYLAASFVGDAQDVITIKNLLASFGNEKIKIIAKIERPVAIEKFDEILKVADGIMVARGDLGVEIPAEEVPFLQKEMIHKCNVAGKPVIVATQMLESMTKAPIATRAEVSDVYNAIEDGADCVMLSAETASGQFPVEAVATMERIIKNAETHFPVRDPDRFDSNDIHTPELMGHLVFSTCALLKAKGYEYGKILCLTQSGFTARMISKYRPELPILAVTQSHRVAREMRLFWGVTPVVAEPLGDQHISSGRVKMGVQACLQMKLITEEEKLVIVGDFFNRPHKTNMISILTAKDVLEDQHEG